MLLCMMYHHINSDKFSISKDIFEKHLEYIAYKFNIVLPGDKLSSKKVNICLFFDDAYFDFYYYVFPLLEKFNVRCVLSVPVKYILDNTDINNNIRLNVKHNQMMKEDICKIFVPFCTWKEIIEMSFSGLIKVASHSYSHCSLLNTKTDINFELFDSKKVISSKTGEDVDVFVYPYGDFSSEVVREVQKYYRYNFAIGPIASPNCNGMDEVMYRINADDLADPISIFNRKNLLRYRFNFYKVKLKRWLKR